MRAWATAQKGKSLPVGGIPSKPYRIDAYIPIPSYLEGKNRFRKPTEEEMKRAEEIAGKYLRHVSILTSNVEVKYKVERMY